MPGNKTMLPTALKVVLIAGGGASGRGDMVGVQAFIEGIIKPLSFLTVSDFFYSTTKAQPFHHLTCPDSQPRSRLLVLI